MITFFTLHEKSWNREGLENGLDRACVPPIAVEQKRDHNEIHFKKNSACFRTIFRTKALNCAPTFSADEHFQPQYEDTKNDVTCACAMRRPCNWPTVQLADPIEYDWSSVKIFSILLCN